MRLSDLLDDGLRLAGDGGVEVGGLAVDSRLVRPGDLFAALSGARADGRRFVADALARGAVALLGDAGLLEPEPPPVPVLVAGDPRRALARAAARFHGRQPRVVAAVTGTNGKTSTASFVRQLWTAMGRPAASIGTLGVEAPGREPAAALTTPEPITLHRTLAGLAAEGVEHLAVEASSHGLDQRRLDGLLIRAAAFTNLTRDHFDYHGTAAAYLAAKRRLFDTLLAEGAGAAVLNADVPEFAELAEVARRRRLDLFDYGRNAAKLRLVRQEPLPDGQRIVFAAEGREHKVDSRLVGGFQAHNLLAALGLVLGCGARLGEVLPHLAGVAGARGRMQLVARHPSGAPAFVDYAHTPDALEQALRALRPHAEGRLVVVFGCGGDRDPGKRPQMGAVAARLADRAIVTDDNPRGEDPAAIRRQVLAGAPGLEESGDREEAIAAGLAGLAPGDLLLVAGKGHESGQTVGDRVLPFDDALVLRRRAAGLGGEAVA